MTADQVHTDVFVHFSHELREKLPQQIEPELETSRLPKYRCLRCVEDAGYAIGSYIGTVHMNVVEK